MCRYCKIIPKYDEDGWDNYWDNEIDIAEESGWTELCELMSHCMDDDQPEEWIYDGDGRPKACPLVEVKEDTDVNVKS